MKSFRDWARRRIERAVSGKESKSAGTSKNVKTTPAYANADAKTIANAARLVGSGGKPTYVMVCGPRPPGGLAEPARGRSLWAQLQAGKPPVWLVPVAGAQPFAVYRVKL